MTEQFFEPNQPLDYASYADKHGIYDTFQHMLRMILIHRPNDPVAFMMNHITNPIAPAVVVCGPPSSGRDEVCRLLAGKLGAVHISTGALLRSAVEKQTSLGNQAKKYMEKNQLVPDLIITGVIFERLCEDEVAEKGWVLDGFPRTREQALAMQRKGVLPTHFVYLNVPDDVIIEHMSNLRVDPVTAKTYHLVSDPPPPGAIVNRLQERYYDSSTAVRLRLDLHNRNVQGVLSCFTHLCRRLTFENGLFGAEEKAVEQILGILSQTGAYGQLVSGPKCYRICVGGGPGSGKTLIAEAMEKRFGVIHVSVKKIIAAELAVAGKHAEVLRQYAKKPCEAPFDIILELLTSRLKQEDCLNHGWILDGIPASKEQMALISSKGIHPNRFLWLSTPTDVLVRRMKSRRYDQITGIEYFEPEIPKHVRQSETLIKLPEDDEEQITGRARQSEKALEDMIDSYGILGRNGKDGIMEILRLPGECSAQGAVEVVEASLLRGLAKDMTVLQ